MNGKWYFLDLTVGTKRHTYIHAILDIEVFGNETPTCLIQQLLVYMLSNNLGSFPILARKNTQHYEASQGEGVTKFQT